MKHLFSFFLLLSMLAGCDSDTTSTGTDNRLKGTMRGRAVLLSLGYQEAPSSSGIKITLEGTSFSTVTNDSGEWELKDVPAGIYTLVYEKEGYGLYKYITYQFVGGGIAYVPSPIRLRKIATTHAELFYVVMKDTLDPEYPTGPPSKRIVIKATIADTVGQYYQQVATFFFSKNPNVSKDPSTYDFVLGERKLWMYYTAYESRPLKDSMFATNLPTGYAASGETIYVIAYGATYTGSSGGYGPGDYYDPSIRKQYYTSVSPSPSKVLSFIVP